MGQDSTIFRSPYQASGTYFDEDHGLSDFGARWHDARTQAFYGVDPAVFADPMVQLSDPGSVRSYAFAGNNPLAYADPDGAACGSRPRHTTACGPREQCPRSTRAIPFVVAVALDV